MRNRAGNNIHFLFNYSGEAMDVVSETLGRRAAERETDIRSASRCVRAWEFTIIESLTHGGAQVEERMELDINELTQFLAIDEDLYLQCLGRRRLHADYPRLHAGLLH